MKRQQLFSWCIRLVFALVPVVISGCSNDSPPGYAEHRQHSGYEETDQQPTNDSIATKSDRTESRDDDWLISSVALAESHETTGSMFTLMPDSETGIVFTNQLKPENMRKYLLNGAGVCTGDFDNDGLTDIYLVCQDGPNKLFRQTDDWKFVDATESAGGLDGGDYWGRGASFADIDNDGDLDLHVCNVDGPDMLYVNKGDGTFVEEGVSGAAHPGATTMGSFADYDRDGDLDLYIVNSRLFAVGEEAPEMKIRLVDGKPTVHPDFRDQYFILAGRVQEAGQQDVLLRNDGQGSFEDVSTGAGISGYDQGLSATWWDYNDDGWLDLYVGNDFKTPDHLYRNNRDGTFADVLASVVPHTPWFSMGADAADLNDDGILDFLIADMSSTTHYKQKTTMGQMGNSAWFLTMGNPRQFMRNACYLSTGTNQLMEVANLTGLDSTDWTWAIKFGDYDNDGKTDAFVTNGYGRNDNDSDFQREYAALKKAGNLEEAAKLYMALPALEEENLAFRGLGDLKFEETGEAWGLNHLGVSNGCSSVDIDRDGDLDLIVNHLDQPLGVYRNDTAGRNRVLFRLVGTQSNSDGIGAKLLLESAAGRQVRQLTLARGYLSADEPLVHFGLGSDETIDHLRIEWPSGAVQSYNNLPVNRMFTVTEPKTPAQPAPKPIKQDERQFVDATAKTGLNFQHQEQPYDDFAREPLLPNKLSQLGPGLAWGDINGDSLFDCYVGGAAGQTGAMFRQTEPGRFEKLESGPFQKHADSEDMGALFLDVDSDGDQDLYVVSGGVECDAGDDVLRDRIYLNENGNFSPAENKLPNITESGSCVTACDFDRDGDLDLFVGSRVIPGRWPLSPESQLLQNENGSFKDVTNQVADGLAEIGPVTGAIWSDANGDGWIDLLVTTEWGPVSVFFNENGQLVNRTEQTGLAEDTGWWNSIAAGDFDHDGDTDYVATNVGLNTKYHASHDKPAQLFVSDFDGDQRLDLVEAEYEGETCFPIRGRSCSSHAMPFIKEKFDTYHEFALAGLDDIYSEDALKKSERFAATRLESVLLINDGTGKFEIRPLPRLAQASPGFGVVVADLNADSHADIYFVQNFMQPQPETGQMDGGLSLMLAGNGKGDFEPVMPAESGLLVAGQGMGLTTIDLNQDAWPDLVATTNNGPLRAFMNRPTTDRQPLTVRLDGQPGNLTGIGAQVTITMESGKVTIAEVYGGSGYLSQSSGELFIGVLADDPVRAVRVHWPDGEVSHRDINPTESKLVISRSSSNSVKSTSGTERSSR